VFGGKDGSETMVGGNEATLLAFVETVLPWSPTTTATKTTTHFYWYNISVAIN
jgi:hypothetical protein